MNRYLSQFGSLSRLYSDLGSATLVYDPATNVAALSSAYCENPGREIPSRKAKRILHQNTSNSGEVHIIPESSSHSLPYRTTSTRQPSLETNSDVGSDVLGNGSDGGSILKVRSSVETTTVSARLPLTSQNSRTLPSSQLNTAHTVNDITSDLQRIRKQLNELSGLPGAAVLSSSFTEGKLASNGHGKKYTPVAETEMLRRYGAIKDTNLSHDTQELLERIRVRNPGLSTSMESSSFTYPSLTGARPKSSTTQQSLGRGYQAWNEPVTRTDWYSRNLL
jgi:hypothetical protein